jgi:hypothetical protein
MAETVAKLEERSLYDQVPAQVPPSDIVAYNELRSCADLFRMHEGGTLEIKPDFQRDFVWKAADQTRFIDSLIKQLPIPSMCFALDYKSQRWIVIDGLQRISTIVRFLKGGSWKLSALKDVDPDLAGQQVSEIKTTNGPLHKLYTRVENLSIPVTVLRCDLDKKAHMEYLFTIFHRLNTAGMKLNNQEIRNCIYGGAFNELLRELDKLPSWRRINKMSPGATYRFTKQEIILRFLAFHDRLSAYDGELAKFLNSYMYDHRCPSPNYLDDKRGLFKRTSDCVKDKIFAAGVPNKLSVTVLEALLVGVSKNIALAEKASSSKMHGLYSKLIADSEFSDSALREGLSKKPRVIARLQKAAEIFSEA